MAISKLEQRKFSKEISAIKKSEELTIMGAIVRYAEIKGVDVTAITKYISKSLKLRLSVEARDLNLLKIRRRKQ